jgi:hypothetical protein
LERDPQVEALVAAYRDGLRDAGMFAENEVTSPARSFLLRVGCEGWSSMSLEQQLAIPGQDRRLVTWLIVTGRLRPTPEDLVASKLRVGQLSARVHREFHGRFMATASELGFDDKPAQLQWWATALVAVVADVSPDRLTKPTFDTARDRLIDAIRQRNPHPRAQRSFTTRLFGAEATLFHAGVIDVPPRKRHWDKSAVRAQEWAAVPSQLRATFAGYIEQMRLSLRPVVLSSSQSLSCSHAQRSMPTSRRLPPFPRLTRIAPRTGSRSLSASARASEIRNPARHKTTIRARIRAPAAASPATRITATISSTLGGSGG